MFGTTAVATLAAGAVQTGQGWAIVNLVAFPALLVAGLATVWFSARRRKPDARAIDGVKGLKES